MKTFFGGSQAMQLAEKNRLRIPAKYKEALGTGYCVFQGPEDCLYFMSRESFETYAIPLLNVLQTDKAGQESRRKVFATLEYPEEDTQGRFVLPANLKKLAGIDKKALFVGNGNRLELWSEDKWNEMDIAQPGSVERAYKELEKYNF